jgi:predicted lipopolysaccharide heptosyltransferase III
MAYLFLSNILFDYLFETAYQYGSLSSRSRIDPWPGEVAKKKIAHLYQHHPLASSRMPRPAWVDMLVKGKEISLNGIERILLIQLGDIGDVVLTTPTIKAIRESYPSSTLYVAVREHARELLEDCPRVDGVISVERTKGTLLERFFYQRSFFRDLRTKRFQTAIDLRTGTRGTILSYLSGSSLRIGRYADDGWLWRNRLFTHLVKPENEMEQYSSLHSLNIVTPLKIEAHGIDPELIVTSKREMRVKKMFEQEGIGFGRPLIAIHPFSRWQYKEWSLENYISLIDSIGSKFPVRIILTGSADESGRAAHLARGSRVMVHNLAGKTTIGDLPAVFKRCALLIGIDSAAMHIAAAVGTPTISIFGPSAPINWAPRGEQHAIVFKDLPCVPCRQKGCNNSGFSRCLRELEIREVLPMVDRKITEIIKRAHDA